MVQVTANHPPSLHNFGDYSRLLTFGFGYFGALEGVKLLKF